MLSIITFPCYCHLPLQCIPYDNGELAAVIVSDRPEVGIQFDSKDELAVFLLGNVPENVTTFTFEPAQRGILTTSIADFAVGLLEGRV